MVCKLQNEIAIRLWRTKDDKNVIARSEATWRSHPPAVGSAIPKNEIASPSARNDKEVGFSGEKGFTLIEVLIATLVLAIGLLSLATLAGTVIRGNSFSNKMTTATTLAQDKMEEIKRQGYAGVTTEAKSAVTDYPAYQRAVSVDASSPASGMKTVTVTVYWDAAPHSVALTTILAE